jgi:hypothetical protein
MYNAKRDVEETVNDSWKMNCKLFLEDVYPIW